MAEALLREALHRRGLSEHFTVASAGTAAIPGAAATDGAIEAMDALGLSLTDHRSSPLTYDAVNAAWLILTMTRDHKLAVINRYPEAADRVYTLGEFAGEPFGRDWEVADPFGGSAKVYAATAAELERVVQHIADYLQRQVTDREEGATVLKVAFGCDHAGFALKDAVVSAVKALGHEILDFGTHSQEPVDYADFGASAAKAVAAGEADLGIVICGTGIGISIAANKIRGIRAALCSDTYSARMSREHNNANVLALGARVVGPGLAEEIVKIFLTTEFAGGRHASRVAKISALEDKQS